MTKQELLKMVEALPDDIIFLLSSDHEGNSYREANLDDMITKAYRDGYEWETVHPDDVAEHEEDGTDLTNVVVFW